MARRGRWVRAGVLVAIVALIVGRWAAVATVDMLWAEALGAGATHLLIRRLQTALALFAFATAAVWCVGNLYLVYRAIGSVRVPRRVGNIEILEAVPRRYLLAGAVVLGVILAAVLSYGAGGWWQVRALQGQEVVVGTSDPMLGRDWGYYLFELPWNRTLHAFAVKLSGVMLVIVFLLYVVVGGVRRVGRRLTVAALARSHVAGLLCAFAITLFWGYRLEPVEYIAGVHGVPVDIVLTRVRLPVARLLSVLALFAAVASLAWIWFPRALVMAASWAGLAGASFVGHYVAPGFAAAVRAPAEREMSQLRAESRRSAEAAFGLPRQVGRPELLRFGDTADLARRAGEVPLWDEFAVSLFLERGVPAEPNTRFTPPALGLYGDGRAGPVPVYLAVRIPDPATLGGVEWGEIHAGRLATTRGVVAIAAGGTSSARLPLFVSDLAEPDRASATVTELALADPDVRFAPGLINFAILSADVEALGVRVSSFWRRLAFAWVLQSGRLLTDRTAGTARRLIWRRDVAERLKAYAPFATFGAAYPVVAGDRLYWLAPGYVHASAFPFAPAARYGDRTVRYLRWGMTGVVDASSGRTAVYAVADPDPLTAAWARLAPELVRPWGDFPPPLAPHVRYPVELFDVQSEVWRALELEGVPFRPPGAGSGATWWIGGGGAEATGRLYRVGVREAGDPAVLAGLLLGTVRDGAARTEIVPVDTGARIPGPSEIGRRFARLHDPLASMPGLVRVVPAGQDVLYVQAAYGMDHGPEALPEVRSVAVGWHGQAAVGATLREAVERLAAPGLRGGPPGSWVEVQRWFRRLDGALRRGDWRGFGEAYEALRRLLGTAPPDSVW